MTASLRNRRLTLPEPAPGPAATLAAELGLPPAVARLLVARGLSTPNLAGALLDPPAPADPLALPGARSAVARLAAAGAHGERVLVYGDYDCDGVCAAALAMQGLSALGLRASVWLPARAEGYGMQAATLPGLARAAGASLVLAVDNGITAHAAVAAAAAAGIEVIIADHHPTDGTLPRAAAVVNPVLAPGGPFDGLAGVGVAWALLQALAAELGASAPPAFDLVAIGTIGDVAPLLGCNRWLVRRGLAEMGGAAVRPGVAALLAACGVPPGRAPATRDVSHGIAPRLNAPGRVDRPHAAYELLMAGDAATAGARCAEVEGCNRRRQAMGEALAAQAEAAACAGPPGARALVLADPRWHPGLVGPAASRLHDRFGVPVLLAGVGEDGLCRGSGRGPQGWDLAAALRACAHLLLRCGGHAQAAGFELRADQLEPLRQALQGLAPPVPEGAAPARHLDGELAPGELGLPLAEALEGLQPFGPGNPEPAFLMRGAGVREAKALSAQGRHCRLRLGWPETGVDAPAIGFGLGLWTEGLAAVGPFDVVVRPEVDRYRGRALLQLVLEDVTPSGGDWGPFLAAARHGLARTHPDRDQLLAAFRRLRQLARGQALPADPALLAELAPGCLPAQGAAAAALLIFREVGLLDDERRLHLPAEGRKVDLQDSARYRAAEAARREVERLAAAAPG